MNERYGCNIDFNNLKNACGFEQINVKDINGQDKHSIYLKGM